MSFGGILQKVTNFGRGELEENLDWDRERAKFLTNPWLRALYLLLYKTSTYLFAFEIWYLGFTRQLDELDIFAFFKKGSHLLQFIIIVLLASAIQLLKDKKL